MKHRGRKMVYLAVLQSCITSIALADPPDQIFGTYSRMSRTCGGGPGFADRESGKDDCGLLSEDYLEISPAGAIHGEPRRKSEPTVDVDYAFHFHYSDYCRFEGPGVWANGKIVLDPALARTRGGHKASASDCRLTLILGKGTVRLSDAQDRCWSSLCTDRTRLHCISYKKATK